MKLKDLQKFVNETLERHPDMGENEVVIRVSKNSVGPRAAASVMSASHGFDWDNGRTFLNPVLPMVVKSNQEELWDMCDDFLHFLWMEAHEHKRMPWYFDRLKRIYFHSGRLAVMESLVEKEKK